jgi:hypothetical protein
MTGIRVAVSTDIDVAHGDLRDADRLSTHPMVAVPVIVTSDPALNAALLLVGISKSNRMPSLGVIAHWVRSIPPVADAPFASVTVVVSVTCSLVLGTPPTEPRSLYHRQC